MDLTLNWDSRDIGVWRDRKVEKAVVRALSKAGGDALRAMKTASSRALRQRKRFKAGRVSKALPIFYPQNKQDISQLVWTMQVSGRPVPLIEFPHRQTKRGVTVSVNAGRSPQLVKGAFIARMKSGHEGIFRRRGEKRLPIDEAFSTRISDVFEDSGMVPAVFARTQQVFRSSFDRLLPLEFAKLHR